MSKTIVLAFSGGLDTSWCVPWLLENRCERVVTVFVDVGGTTPKEIAAIAERSQELGAAEHVHVDARVEYFNDVIRWLIVGHVLRGHLYPLCVGAERNLQAKRISAIALAQGADAVAHGCTAAGNDQVRFEIAFRTLAPSLAILAPIRDLAPTRVEEIEFLESRGFSVPPQTRSYSINSGLWGVTIGGRETTSTQSTIPEDAWLRTKGAFERNLPAEVMTLSFAAGIPTHLDGKGHEPSRLIELVDRLASAFGIGRGIHLGDTILGVKGRVAFEAPAATVLMAAHRELEKVTLTQMQQDIKDQLAKSYGELIHTGRHLDPACRDIEALFQKSQESVTGEVRVLLRPGHVFVEGATSPFSIHKAAHSIYGEEAKDWSPEDARGFCTLAALPTRLAHVAKGAAK